MDAPAAIFPGAPLLRVPGAAPGTRQSALAGGGRAATSSLYALYGNSKGAAWASVNGEHQ